MNRFFVSAVRFLSGAYTVEYKKKMATGITISDSYRQTWDQICQTWFLSMQGEYLADHFSSLIFVMTFMK